MTSTEIYWNGLRNDRERTIFCEAFWDGVNARDEIEKSVIELETKWAIERNRVQRAKAEATKRNVMARRSEQDQSGGREVVSEVQGNVRQGDSTRKVNEMSDERFCEIARDIVRLLTTLRR